MPLDAIDIEKITVIVERAITRVESDIRSLMPRSEYEQRHIELYNRAMKNERSIEEVVKWAMSEHEKISSRIDGRFTFLDTGLKEANKQLDEVKEMITHTQLTDTQRRDTEKNTTIRYMITVIVGIAIGIAIPLLLRVLGV